MALVRCERCGVQKAGSGQYKRQDVRSVQPGGYPNTALVCGRPTCDQPGVIWLESSEAQKYESGQRVFQLQTNATEGARYVNRCSPPNEPTLKGCNFLLGDTTEKADYVKRSIALFLKFELDHATKFSVSSLRSADYPKERRVLWPLSVYELTVFGTGEVVHKGELFVKETGEGRAKISQQRAFKRLKSALEIGFFELKSRYENGPNYLSDENGRTQAHEESATDLPTYEGAVQIRDQRQKVTDYYEAPFGWRQFENMIDRVCRSQRWVGTREGG